MDSLSKELSATQQSLEFVSSTLRDCEARAPPPREGASAASDGVSSDALHALDLLLRRVGAAQAALPDAREANGESGGLHVQLQDVDADTRVSGFGWGRGSARWMRARDCS